MTFIRGLFDRIVLVAAFLAGCLLPGFIVQYQQRLGGRLDQVSQDLERYQKIADRLHDGSLSKLINHHLNSPDQTFQSEGTIIQALVDNLVRYGEAYIGLNDTLFNQILFLSKNLDYELAEATWQAFTPSASIAPDALLFAGLFAFTVWLIFMFLWFLLSMLLGGRRKRRKRRLA